MRIADLCCAAGGAAMGLRQAFPDAVIHGFDIDPRYQRSYPFMFHRKDALEVDLDGFDMVWASPPCQAHSTTSHMPRRGDLSRATHKDLIAPMREKLQAWGGYWIMENVPGAPLRYPVMLCGTMFGLRVFRHRLFESSIPHFAYLVELPHAEHTQVIKRPGKGKMQYWINSLDGFVMVAGKTFSLEVGRKAMGIPWMSRYELTQAIPPAYSRHIGERISRVVLDA